MSNTQVLNWPGGAGWLVLSGEADSLDEIRGVALSRINNGGGVAYVGLRNSDHEDLIEDMGELGAPTGYLVDVINEDDKTIIDLLSESGMVFLPDMDAETLRSALTGAGYKGIEAAYARGAVILAEGEAATLFGAVLHNGAKGLNWLENAFILPNVISLGESEAARAVLNEGTAEIAIGIGPGSALALGPDQRVDALGEGKVTIALGGAAAENGTGPH